MKQQPSFDSYAADYDDHFTNSSIGQAQRRQVWQFLKPFLATPKRILEVNCGTGTDALRLAKLGHEVVATDASAEMIGVSRAKIKAEKQPLNLHFQQAAFLDLEAEFSGEKFDLIFSNFGGLNCLSGDKTKELAVIFSDLLKPNGYLFLVYMSKNCGWERAYYHLKGEKKQATRRRQGPLKVPVGESEVEVWYYSPGELAQSYVSHFNIQEQHPIGLLVPPSYLEHYFAKRRHLLNLLERMDRFLDFPFLADYGDHFLLVMKKGRHKQM